MLFDYYHLGEIWKRIEPFLDHRDLNESIPGLRGLTTAENIGCWIFGQFQHILYDMSTPGNVVIHEVVIRETDDTYAEITHRDWEEFNTWQARLQAEAKDRLLTWEDGRPVFIPTNPATR
jgi:6-pyruvoyl-tetrahydropterin synthase